MLFLGLERGIPIGDSLTIEELIEQTLFSDYEERLQKFLTELSVMDAFTGQQAGFVTGFSEAEETLRILLRENSFIAYDESRKVYEIHTVILDFLRKKQNFDEPQRKKLFCRLGQWCLQQQEFETGYHFLYQAEKPNKCLYT